MFFARGYVESERRLSTCSTEEHDILRELLLDGEFMSPQPLSSSTIKHSNLSASKRQHHQVEVSIPQICFDNVTCMTRLQPLSTRHSAGLPSLPTPSHQLSASIMNAIISPPRVFIQEFARMPPPFFHEALNSALEAELQESKAIKPAVPLITSCLPPPPLPMLTMPPLKKKKTSTITLTNNNNTANNVNGEKKQLRCSYPDCPNLRRSAGLCNRHSGKICSVTGCDKSALSRGKCPEHGGGSRCKQDGCSKFAQTRGLCKSHGGGRQCNVGGCTKNAHQNRLCRSHGGGKRCDYYGCPKWAQRSGYCCAHTKLGTFNAAQNARTFPSPPTPAAGMIPVLSPTLMSPHRLLSLLP